MRHYFDRCPLRSRICPGITRVDSDRLEPSSAWIDALTGLDVDEFLASAAAQESEGLPFLPWATKDLVADRTGNFEDALIIANSEPSLERKADTVSEFFWRVCSQFSDKRKYTIALQKTALVRPEKVKVRDAISCACLGCKNTGKDAEGDRICKHCGAFLLLCIREQRKKRAIEDIRHLNYTTKPMVPERQVDAKTLRWTSEVLTDRAEIVPQDGQAA